MADRTCDCWVSRADEYTRFVTRYGAHATTCPEYRESGDPLDRRRDEMIRRHGMTSTRLVVFGSTAR